MHNINHSERLPYEKLAALGIDREKADSLPQEVKEKAGIRRGHPAHAGVHQCPERRPYHTSSQTTADHRPAR